MRRKSHKRDHKEHHTTTPDIFRKPDPFDVALWGLVATVIIAVIYFLQLLAMQETVRQSTKGTELTRQQLAAVYGARIAYWFTPNDDGLAISVSNSPYPASPAKVAMRIAVIRDGPSGEILASDSIALDCPRVDPDRGCDKTYKLTGFTPELWREIQQSTKSFGQLKVSGSIWYEDGFSMATLPICKIWYAHPTIGSHHISQWVECDNYAKTVKEWQAMEANQDQ